MIKPFRAALCLATVAFLLFFSTPVLASEQINGYRNCSSSPAHRVEVYSTARGVITHAWSGDNDSWYTHSFTFHYSLTGLTSTQYSITATEISNGGGRCYSITR